MPPHKRQVFISKHPALAVELSRSGRTAAGRLTFTELRNYLNTDEDNSTGLHMEFLKTSVAIVQAAPVFGHGTGSIAAQLRLAAAGEAGYASAVATVNPHSQI